MDKVISADVLFAALREDYNIPGACLARVKRHIDAAPAVDDVVLPCNVGDMVWFTTYGKPTCTTVCGVQIYIAIDGLHSCFDTYDFCGNTDCFHGEAFGKTVFLTRDEAEAELAKMDGGNDNE